ncbi:hypothetical protein DWW99_09115 [[Clostridium] leptum]|nr:hypothetical protein DWW99_09115 [[Clostridium] leptum]
MLFQTARQRFSHSRAASVRRCRSRAVYYDLQQPLEEPKLKFKSHAPAKLPAHIDLIRACCQ